MDTNAYITFLVVGVLMIVIDGQLIHHNGKRYLADGGSESGASMSRLIGVLFHLVVLGVLALLSIIEFPGGGSLPGIVGRLGVLLLVMALAHAAALSVLTRMREEQAVEEFQATAPVDRQPRQPVVTPVPGQRGRDPRVSPSVEQEPPYSTER